jgi:arylsulfatase A-like enzyme
MRPAVRCVLPTLLLFASLAQTAERPNIVVILADDLGCGDLGCYNKNSIIPTPNLDRLAEQGMRFTDAHSPSAVCTPTRYGILTGQYCWRTRLKQGVLQGYDPLLIEPGRMTIASMLKKHGYATHCVGKWHLGLGDRKPTDYDQPLKPGPLSVGFDTFFGIPASLDMPPYVHVKNETLLEKPTGTIAESKMRRHGGGGFWRAGSIAPGFKHEEVLPKLTEQALQIIRNHAAQSEKKPLCLYFALTAPHTPWMPVKEFQGQSKAGWYGDFVMQTDVVVGQVMKALKMSGMEENTLLFVASDNGAHWTPEDIKQFGHSASNGRRGQKADIWEAGHRIPLLARWPGKIKAGTVSEELVGLIDLMATCAEVVGQKLPASAGEDSESFLPVLQGARMQAAVHEALVHHSGGGMFAIRQGDWKLIEGLGSGGFTPPHSVKPQPDGPKGQLYNLAKDPQEKQNLYDKHPEQVKRLGELLEKYRKQGYSARRLART